MSAHLIRSGSGITAFLMAMWTALPSAHALQPLEAFVASAAHRNPDNLYAVATAQQRVAQSDVVRAAYLPSLTAQGVYTRNQYEVSFTLTPGQTATITRRNALDAYVTLAVPIINVGAWAQHKAANLNAAAADASKESTAITVAVNVAQTYFQLVGTEAVLAAAGASLECAEHNERTVRDRHALGSASELDLQRAIADVAGARQDLATAEREVKSTRRALESLSRLTPEPATAADFVEASLDEEAPLSSWMDGRDGVLVAAKPAVLATQAARATRAAARAAWLPTIGAQGQEHFTNANGFTGGNNRVYTLTATATWRLDFALLPNTEAQSHALVAASANEDKSRRAAEDSIYQAWHQVHAGIEKARAARARRSASSIAVQLANDRYAQGTATQLEVLQAQRDLFSSSVSQFQVDADLAYARVLLRLVSRRDGSREVVQ